MSVLSNKENSSRKLEATRFIIETELRELFVKRDFGNLKVSCSSWINNFQQIASIKSYLKKNFHTEVVHKNVTNRVFIYFSKIMTQVQIKWSKLMYSFVLNACTKVFHTLVYNRYRAENRCYAFFIVIYINMSCSMHTFFHHSVYPKISRSQIWWSC